MVKFYPDRFTIEVVTNCNPIESWLNMHSEMIDLLQSDNDEVHTSHYYYLELMREMMPDLNTAKKMVEEQTITAHKL